MNNDGSRKVGFAAPSQDRQAAVIAEAMEVAGVRPAEIGYVEGHGTGTPLGDPIEVAALAAAFRGVPAGACLLGSAKSNLGHTETAAGVTGLIKAVLMLEHATIVPGLHAAHPATRIPWAETPFVLAAAARPWTGRLVAGVSSFGIGGTNAHVVLRRGAPAGARPVPVAFVRTRHWADTPPPPLLGPAVATPFDAVLHTVEPGRHRWLADHVVEGIALLPAAFHLALFAEAGVPSVAEVVFCQPLGLGEADAVQLWRHADGRLRVMARRGEAWSCVAEARAAAGAAWEEPAWALAGGSDTGGSEISGPDWAARMAESGLGFGPAFRRIVRLWRDGGAVRAELAADPAPVVTLLDAGLQALGAAVAVAETGFRPAQVGRFAVTGAVDRCRFVQAWLTGEAPDTRTGDVLWLGAAGEVVAQALGVVCRRARPRGAELLFRLCWRPDADPAVMAPHDALEAIACGFARDALAAVAVPARPELAALLRPHAERAGPDDAPEAACRALAARHPAHAAEIALVARCGAALADVLTGRRDPLEVLFGAGGADGAYAGSPLARRLNAVAASVARAARPRRVIEIGGGTAATTAALRDALEGAEEVLFTDLSAAFLAAAGARFAGWPGFRTARLDIAADPVAQGIPAGAWDLVVAANVLHAAPDLAEALGHAVALLAPGGRLLLVEGVAALARLDITFGMTAGWTARRDHGLRPDHPLVSVDTWRRLLAQAGLHDIVVTAEAGGQAVLTARRGEPGWLAVGRDAMLAGALGLPFLRLGESLPPARLEGVLALAGLEAGADPLVDVLEVARALPERADAPRLLVPTRGAEAIGSAAVPDPARAALGGFLRTLAREHPALRPRAIDFDATSLVPAALAEERVRDDGEDRVAWRGGCRMLARLEPVPPPAPPVVLTPALALAPLTLPEPGPGEVLVRVRAAGLNFKDALVAAGRMPAAGPGLGGECAGEVVALGERVDGLRVGDEVVAVAAGALASHVLADARLVLRKPAALGFAEAAAVPVAGVTAWYGLHHLARLVPGQRVLVHAATGGVGWFARRFAEAAGAVVVASAGSAAKRRVLADAGVAEVLPSRAEGFSGVAPVDVVIGALTEGQRLAALALLRPGGCYVEIGRAGVPTDAAVAVLRPDIAWHVVALDAVDAPFFAGLLREVLAAVAADRSLLPPVSTLPLGAAADGLAAMMRAAHVGKLVALPDVPAEVRADGSYLVTGGLGGLGPAIVAWLRGRGAGGVVVLARDASAARRAALAPEVPAAEPAEVTAAEPAEVTAAEPAEVQVVAGDVADPAALAEVAARLQAAGLPRLRGVVHAAGVLADGLVSGLDPAGFARVARPKLAGLAALRAQWPQLDWLVGFSSAGGLFGSAGQATHTVASAAFDAALAAARAQGLAAVALDWGAWRGAGAAARRGVRTAGIGAISPAEGFAALDAALAACAGQAAVLPLDWPALRAGGVPALLRDLLPEAQRVAEPAVAPAEPDAGMAPAERRAWLRERIAGSCAGLLTASGPLPANRPLHDLGLNSLAALELRNRLGRLVGAMLPASLLFDYPTVAALAEHLAISRFGLAPVRDGDARPAEAEDDGLAALSEDDLDAVLAGFAARHDEAAP